MPTHVKHVYDRLMLALFLEGRVERYRAASRHGNAAHARRTIEQQLQCQLGLTENETRLAFEGRLPARHVARVWQWLGHEPTTETEVT